MIAVIIYGTVETYRSPHKTGGLVLVLIGIYGLWMRWRARNDPASIARMQRLTMGKVIFWILCFVAALLLWVVLQAR